MEEQKYNGNLGLNEVLRQMLQNDTEEKKNLVYQVFKRLKEKLDEQKHFYETASISHRDISLTALNTAYRCLDETIKEIL